MRLLSGFPLKEDYLRLFSSNLYKELELYSNKFIKDNKDILQNYSRRWVTDPFHQWSRQWEYPYMVERLRQFIKWQNRSVKSMQYLPGKVLDKNNNLKSDVQNGSVIDKSQIASKKVSSKVLDSDKKIFETVSDSNLAENRNGETICVLDTGSGLTFIPYFIQSTYPTTQVKAIDKDQYREQFQAINRRLNTSISFTQQNIKNIQIQSETIDFLYCISVIEHIPQKFFKQTIFELWRILKPTGRLILTLDINYNNGGIQRIKELENIIPGKFVFENIPNYILDNSVVNTHWMYDKFGTKLFPGSWKGRTKTKIPKLTVFCVTLIKLGDRED